MNDLCRISVNGSNFITNPTGGVAPIVAGDAIICGAAPALHDEHGYWKRCLSQAEVTQLYNGGAGLTYPFAEPSFDADALDFFSRADIADSTQQAAVNNLVLALKAVGIWAKMRALYPFVGGNAATHSHNLISSSHQIVWLNNMMHDDGITGNAANAWGDTQLNISTTTLGSIAFGAYNKTNSSSGGPDICAIQPPNEYGIFPAWTDSHFYGNVGVANTYVDVDVGTSNRKGFYVMTRQSQSVWKAFKNGTQLGGTRSEPAIIPLPDANFKLLTTGNCLWLQLVLDC